MGRENLEYQLLNSLFRWDENPYEEEALIEIIREIDEKIFSSKGREFLFRAIRKIVEDTGLLPESDYVISYVEANAPKIKELIIDEVLEAMSYAPCISSIIKKQILPLIKKMKLMEELQEIE